MRKNYFIFALFLLFICSCSYGQDLIIGAMKNVKIFDFGNGRLVSTYEDVSNINIQPRFDGCSLPSFNYSDLPSSPIRYSEKNNYLSKIVPGAIIPEPPSDGKTFLQKNFYLDFGYESNGEWVSQVVGKDGSPNTNSQDPGRSPQIWYCLNGSFKVVNSGFSAGSLSISADGISCIVAQYLCPVSNCTHLIGYPNVITNLQSIVEGKSGEIEDSSFDAASLQGKGSGIFGQIVFKDRTPPWVVGCSNNRFPTIGESSEIFTGDWFCFDELKIHENSSKRVKAKIALGEIGKPPNPNDKWIDREKWDGDYSVQTVDFDEGSKERLLNTVLSPPPNYCYGYMRYTVFLDDVSINSKSKGKGQIGNLNPGCASIIENAPTECYGLPKEYDFSENLLTSPGGAKAWPYRANRSGLPASLEKRMSIDTITHEENDHIGYIKILDNDLPNILIKLTSAKYGEEKQIFFPPCMPAGKLSIIDYGEGTANKDAYKKFVGETRDILRECNYLEVKNSKQRPYFTIIDLAPSKHMNDRYITYRDRFLRNSDPDFINKHFRLEDQTISDTDDKTGRPDDKLDKNGESLLGMRNGTWKKVVAFVGNLDDSEVEIQEDVEYNLSVWADDSVKWANCLRDNMNEDYCESNNIPIPSGIYKGKITIDIPNQSPSYHRVIDFSNVGESIEEKNVVDKSVQEPIRIVFREPTENVDPKVIRDKELKEDFFEGRFPSIRVEATDYANNTRIIKLYFRVKDENAKIKTIQRRHQQY